MFFVLFSYLILLRLGELILAKRNRRWAMAQGGLESDRRQYRVIVAVHILFYLSLWLEWKYRSHGWNTLLIMAAQSIHSQGTPQAVETRPSLESRSRRTAKKCEAMSGLPAFAFARALSSASAGWSTKRLRDLLTAARLGRSFQVSSPAKDQDCQPETRKSRFFGFTKKSAGRLNPLPGSAPAARTS